MPTSVNNNNVAASAQTPMTAVHVRLLNLRNLSATTAKVVIWPPQLIVRIGNAYLLPFVAHNLRNDPLLGGHFHLSVRRLLPLLSVRTHLPCPTYSNSSPLLRPRLCFPHYPRSSVLVCGIPPFLPILLPSCLPSSEHLKVPPIV